MELFITIPPENWVDFDTHVKIFADRKDAEAYCTSKTSERMSDKTEVEGHYSDLLQTFFDLHCEDAWEIKVVRWRIIKTRTIHLSGNNDWVL